MIRTKLAILAATAAVILLAGCGVPQDKYDADMAELAEERNIAAEKLEADIGKKEIEEGSKERRLATEVALRERTGTSSGGSV